MSAETTDTAEPGPRFRDDELRLPMLIAFGVGAVGLLATIIGAIIDPASTARGYLVGFFFALGLPLGALGLVLLHHLVGGDWGEVVRGPLEALMMTIPIPALAFVPIAFALPSIFPWARPDHHASGSTYMSTWFFLIRAFVYFAFWVGAALWLYWDSPNYNPGDHDAHADTVREMSAGGLVVFFVTTTFAYVDWGMSLTPDWISTIWGLMILVGHVLLALAALLAVTGWFARRHETFAGALTPARLNDLGNLLLVFVALWAYTSFSQYLIIWSGDKLHEIPWYLARASGGWFWIPPILILLQFIVPLAALLFRPFKRGVVTLGVLAATILGLRFVDTTWLLAPSFAATPGDVPWTLYTATVGLVGLVVGAWLWLIAQRPLFRPDHLGHSTPMETQEIAHVPD